MQEEGGIKRCSKIYKQHAHNFKFHVQIKTLIPKSAAERPKCLKICHYMFVFSYLIDIYLLNGNAENLGLYVYVFYVFCSFCIWIL